MDLFTFPLVASADDYEKKNETTVDTFENPVTGSKTTTRTQKRKMKDQQGRSYQVSVKEKTKQKRDGCRQTNPAPDAPSWP